MLIGAESTKDAELNAKKICKEIQKLSGIKIKKFDFRITNLIGTFNLGICFVNLGFKVHLEKLCDQGNGVKVDHFIGVFYRPAAYVKASTIYASGKVTLIGATSMQDLEKAAEQIKKYMIHFKKPEFPPTIVNESSSDS